MNMATQKKTTPVVAPITTAPIATTTATEPNKADSIRQYAAQHPEARPADIVKALAAQGVEVSASRVSTVLATGKKKTAVDIDGVKNAAAFVKSHEGDVDGALEAIKSVGAFIDLCGGSEEAIAALEAYRTLADSIR
jgi:hypothetical protein